MSRFVLTAQLQLQAPTNVGQVVKQIQNQLNNVQVNVKVQGAQQAQRQLNNITQSTQQASNAASQLGRNFGLSIKRFAAFTIATRAVSLFTSTLSKAIQESIAFERELIKISQVTGKTLGQLRDLTNEITRLSTSLGVSSTSLLSTSRILSQAGLNADETRIALDALAKSELAPTFDDIGQTAEGVVAIFNQFQAGAEALEAQLGSINAVAGKFAVEAGDLISVVRRTGGVFKAAGGDLNELIALFTSVRATTRESAESIATGLRTIFTRIQRPKTIEFLRRYGVELLDLEGKFVGPFEATKRLSEALAGLEQGDITFVQIAEELGGFRQIGKVIPLLQQFSVAQEALNVAQEGSGSLAEDAAKAQLSLAVRITKVKEEFLALVRSITETTAFQVMANTVLSLAESLIKLADALKPILPLLLAFAGIKIARGFGSFLGGIRGGLQTPRAFATGGLVPGSGNRDTVPAMLTPGEFVIRKSSVAKLGAGNLAAMNENRYAAGGEVVLRVKPNKFGGMFLSPPTEGDSTINSPQGRQVKDIYAKKLTQKIERETGSLSETPGKQAAGKGNETRLYNANSKGGNKPNRAFAQFVKGKNRNLLPLSGSTLDRSSPEVQALEKQYLGTLSTPAKLPMKGDNLNINTIKIAADSGAVPSLIASNTDFNQGLQDEVTNIAYNGMKSMVSSVINSEILASRIGPERLKKIRPNVKKSVASLFRNDPQQKINSARAAIEGYLLEGIIGGVTGSFPESGGAVFDILRPGRGDPEGWADLYGPSSVEIIRQLEAADAKRSATKKNKASIIDKIGKYLADDAESISQFATVDRRRANRARKRSTKRAFFGGLIQKLAAGGIVNAGRNLYGDAQDPNLASPKQVAFIESLLSQFQKTVGVRHPATDEWMPPDSKAAASSIISKLKATIPELPLIKQFLGKGINYGYGSAGSGFVVTKFPPMGRVQQRPLSQFNGNIAQIQEYIKRGELAFGSNAPNSKGQSANSATSRLRTRSNYGRGGYKYALGGLIKEFASGGNVGTDTVPALLTPGEFVVNRSSAQKIGYGNLNRMNKVGKYANGGVVQHFAGGTTGSGVSPISTGPLSTMKMKDLVRVEAAMAKNATVFEQLNVTIPTLKTDVEAQTAAYKALTRSLEAGKKAEDALEDARDAAAKQITKSSKGYGKADRTTATPNVVERYNAASPSEKATMKVAPLQAQAQSGQLSNANIAQGLAKGTIDPNQAKLLAATNAQAVASNKAAMSNQKEAIASDKAAQADMKQSASTKGAANSLSGLGMGLTMGAATLQSFLPPLTESSSGLMKFSHGLLGTITAIGGIIFMLQSFGLTLSVSSVANAASAAASFLMGTAGTAAAAATVSLATSAGAASVSLAILAANAGAGGVAKALFKFGGWITKAGPAIGKFVGAAVKFAGPAVAVAASAFLVTKAFNGLISSVYDQTKALEEAKKAGDVQKTEKIAGEQYDLEAANTTRAVGAGAGALIGSIFGPLGTIIGGAVGSVVGTTVGTVLSNIPFGDKISEALNVAFGGQTKDSYVKIQGAQAQAAKAAKSLAEAADKTSAALKEFENGTMSASDVVKASSQATKDANDLRKKTDAAVAANEENKAGTLSSFGRGALRVGTLGIAGLLGVESGDQRNARIDEENKGLNETAKKAEQDAIKAAMPGIQVLSREVAATGGSFSDFQEKLKATDPALAELLLRNGATEIKKTFDNLAKEAEKTRKAFQAMNLGFQKVSAVSGALSVNMENYLASQEAGYSGLENTIRTLEASVTNAAQGISDQDFNAALGSAANGLKKLGATDAQVQKFEENLTAINTAQKFYAQASEEVKNRLMAEFERGGGAGQSAEAKKATFADVITDQLKNAGIGDAARQRISDAIAGADISNEDLTKIMEGDMSTLDRVLTELGETTLKQVIGPLQELAKYEQQLVNITKKRLDLENSVVSAQQNLISAQMESAELIAKYGGPAVTGAQRTQSILDQANVQSDQVGVSRLQTGSAGELNRRSAEINAQLQGIANVRQSAAAGDANALAQLEGESGVKLAEQEKRLQELAKSDYETTKNLIKQKEEELRIIGEKNKAEKAAIDSLLAGDIEKFFEQQAAVGATAAIATGNQSLMNAYGAKALGAAAQDIRRQQEAGVTSIYGQDLAGAGGLTERAYGAGLAARGVTGGAALGMAQTAAGTTGEEEAAKSEIRELAATLPNYAQTQLQVAEDSLQTANIQYQAAQMQLEAAKANVEQRAGNAGQPGGVATMARGGVVYANRGLFVPRGTDTVPAMLTPGEFVVRREAVRRGNNLQLLQSINRGRSGVSNTGGGAVGMANGGLVNQTQYLSEGGFAQAISSLVSGDFVGKITQTFTSFISGMNSAIDKLKDTSFQVKLETANVNVNLTGGNFLAGLRESIKQELMSDIAREIENYGVGPGGKLQKKNGILQ